MHAREGTHRREREELISRENINPLEALTWSRETSGDLSCCIKKSFERKEERTRNVSLEMDWIVTE